MKITFIGAGNVGAPLAARLVAAGHDVSLARGQEASPSITAALERDDRLVARPLAEAVQDADVVVLATPFAAAQSVLAPLSGALAGKLLVDCTNPVGPGLSHGLDSKTSGSEQIQALVPGAHVVKAFSIYGYENLEDSSYPGYDLRPAMLYCGDDDRGKEHKARAAELIEACGFEAVDVGGLAQALHLEHMTLLWVRLVRAGGHDPGLTWAALRRPRPQ